MKRNLAILLVALSLPTISPGADARGPDSAELLQTGMRLPPLTGNYLTGRKVTLPDAASGKIGLLALGFTYDSRFAVEEWTKHFRERFRSDARVAFYEIPMLGGTARLAR